MKLRQTARILAQIISVMLLALIVGCQGEPPLPTAITLPTETPSLTPIASPIATETPLPNMTPTPAPTEFFGRTIQSGPGKGQVRAMNLTSDSSMLDLYLDGLPFTTDLRPTYISGQSAILPGTYTASLNLDGTGATTPLTIAENQNLDIVVVGGGDDRQIMLISQPTDPVNADEVWLTFANALPDVGQITVTLDDSPVTTLEGFSTSTPSIGAAGEHILRATTGDKIILEQSVILRELTLYTFILTVNPSAPDAVQLQRFESPVLGRYNLRVVNLSAESREVDLYLNGTRLAEMIGFGGSTTPIEVVTGLQHLSVYTAGADRNASAPLVNEHTFSGQAGSSLMLILNGPASAVQVVSFEADTSPVPEGSSRVVFYNATADVMHLSAGIAGDIFPDFNPIAAGQFSPPQLVQHGDIPFTFMDEDDENNNLFERKTILLFAGQTILYTVTGRDDFINPVYSYPVEQSAALYPDGVPLPQSRLRFVNGLASGVAVDVYVNGSMYMPAMIAPSGGPLSPVIGEDFALLVRQAGNGPALLDIHLGIPSPGDYSVFLYGSPADGLETILINDDALRINDDIGTLRLVNLSGDPTDLYSLGYYLYPPDVTPLAPTMTPFPTPVPTFDPAGLVTPVPTEEPFTAPLDVRRIIRDVRPHTASSQNIAPQGLFDLTLIDTNRRILGNINALQIPIGQHYDIVGYTYRSGDEVKTQLFIAPYPPR